MAVAHTTTDDLLTFKDRLKGILYSADIVSASKRINTPLRTTIYNTDHKKTFFLWSRLFSSVAKK